MRFPKFLKENGTIGYVAPSFGCASDPYKSGFDAALLKFREKGHGADIGPNCYEASGIGISNTKELCGRELSDWYIRDKNDVLISCGGGELMCEVLDYVDFDVIRNSEPKWFMGYSDNTNFTFPLTTICDVASVYAPCASTFGMEVWHKALEDAYLLIRGKKNKFEGYDKWEKESLRSETNPCPPYNVTEASKTYIYSGKEADDSCIWDKGNVEISGRLLGGCLDCLEILCGTKYDNVKAFNNKYGNEGILWFVESCDLNVFSMRRALWKLKSAGWFDNATGILIGRPYHFGEEMMGLNQYSAVCGGLSDLGIPILMDMDIGHLPPMIPLVLGSRARVSWKDSKYCISMEFE